MVMPFGKHAGVDVCDLPDAYLWWLFLQPKFYGADPLELEALRVAVEAEHAHRFGWRRDDDDERARRARASVYAPRPRVPAELRPVAERIVAAGYRALALEAHPDRGGDTSTMQAVNAAVAALRAVVAA